MSAYGDKSALQSRIGLPGKDRRCRSGTFLRGVDALVHVSRELEISSREGASP
jgi:hypothetical protein